MHISIMESSSAKGTERAGSDNWPKLLVHENLMKYYFVLNKFRTLHVDKMFEENKIKSKIRNKLIMHAVILGQITFYLK